jgi:hypothetical protein
VGCFMLAGAGRIFLVLNSTFCINSVCHLWGSQHYSRSNSSRDSWWVSLISLGEGYHNYHHTFPRDYRNGHLWYNVDPSKWLIYTLSKLGLAEGLVRCNSGSRAWSREAEREDTECEWKHVVLARKPRGRLLQGAAVAAEPVAIRGKPT